MSENKWFGTDGVRGIANEFPMTADFAFKLAAAVSSLVCVNHKKVAVAKDTRVSGDMLEAALVAGFTSSGVDVVRLGVVPTPAVTTFVADLDVDMAVMITASHNPYFDNGIKLIASDGDKFSDEITSKIENLIEKNEFVFDKDKLGRVSDSSIKQKYMDRAYTMFQEENPLSGMKVVIDCANGCFFDIFPEILSRLGAEIVPLGTMPDGYNINRDCGSQHVETMLQKVRETGADVGIAVDGDGDRIKISDEKGSLIKSEQLMAFLVKDMEENGENKGRGFASTKLSNTALERYVTQELKQPYYSTGVGERLVIKALKEHGGVVGGEESGHIVLLEYAKSGDAMMTALRFLKGAKSCHKKVSEIFPLFDEDFLYFENFKASSREQVKKIAANAEIQDLVNELNRNISGSGRVVIHPSGTEPKIRVWVCGADAQTVKNYGNLLLEKIAQIAQI
ncbi:MAG: phosphoglucosamine mutase [Alphaproteobacteria bacterium]|nr:phosphoglucosamine mutase [Alphaproteobacteria bacterium]